MGYSEAFPQQRPYIVMGNGLIGFMKAVLHTSVVERKGLGNEEKLILYLFCDSCRTSGAHPLHS